MLKRTEAGSAATIAVIAVLALALVGSLAFGSKAFVDGRRYKTDVDKIVAEEVTQAETTQAEKLKNEFAEQSKLPYDTFQGSSTYGTVSFNYPRTWSAYVDESSSSQPLNGYLHPKQVPAVSGDKSTFALRVEVVNTSYSAVLQSYDSKIKAGDLKAAAYVPPKMVGVANLQPGTKLDGEITTGQQGSIVILKVRDKTLKVYTQSLDYLADFTGVILPSLTFVP